MKNKITLEQIENSLVVIDKWLEYQQFFKRIPGLSVGVVYKDKVVFSKGYGYENLEKREKSTASSYYRIASISKTFTATAIMQLIEQEKLNLDDTVQKHLQWFMSENDKNLSNITIRHILNHTSGINRDGNTAHWEDDNFPTLEKIQEQIQSGISVYPPGKRYQYSNLGYAILGTLIETVTGKTYAEYIHDAILNPLNMSNTYPDLDAHVKSKLAKGYSRDIPGKDRTEFPFPNTYSMSPATGFISNVDDLCKYLSAHFTGNYQLLSDKSKKEMQEIQWNGKDDNNSYGLGFEIWGNDTKQLVGHQGDFQGYVSQIAMDKENKIGVVVLTNAIDGPAHLLTNGIFHIINFFNKHSNYFKQKTSMTNTRVYEGLFTGRWDYMQTVAINGHLLGFYPSEDIPTKYVYELMRLKNHEFKIKELVEQFYDNETITFAFDYKGQLVSLFWGPNPMTLTTLANPPFEKRFNNLFDTIMFSIKQSIVSILPKMSIPKYT